MRFWNKIWRWRKERKSKQMRLTGWGIRFWFPGMRPGCCWWNCVFCRHCCEWEKMKINANLSKGVWYIMKYIWTGGVNYYCLINRHGPWQLADDCQIKLGWLWVGPRWEWEIGCKEQVVKYHPQNPLCMACVANI